jgi:hypothetical protein
MSTQFARTDLSVASVADRMSEAAADTSTLDRPHAAVRGIMFGVLFAVPFWAVLVIIVYLMI